MPSATGPTRSAPSTSSACSCAPNRRLDTVILGPSVDNELALEFAERERATNPTLGVILVRRRIDAAILTQAIRSGVREVVAERDLPAVVEAVQRSRKLTFALRNPGESMSVSGGRGCRSPSDGLLTEGRRRKDHLCGQRRRRAGRQGLLHPPARPGPRVRRRPDLPRPAP